MSWRHVVFAGTLLAYVALSIAIVVGSPLSSLDHRIMSLHIGGHNPRFHRFFLDYVMLGQRGPSTLAALPFVIWLCHRRRSLQPMLRLVTALLVLNLSVGIVKVAIGRIGPAGGVTNAHAVFAGGDIFPSGHVSNTVVLYGVLALIVAPRYRPAMAALAVWISVTVGFGTIFLRTHWLTDVIGAWLAGALVLMVLPRCEPLVQRAVDWAGARIVAWWRARRSQPQLDDASGLVVVHAEIATAKPPSAAGAKPPSAAGAKPPSAAGGAGRSGPLVGAPGSRRT